MEILNAVWQLLVSFFAIYGVWHFCGFVATRFKRNNYSQVNIHCDAYNVPVFEQVLAVNKIKYGFETNGDYCKFIFMADTALVMKIAHEVGLILKTKEEAL